MGVSLLCAMELKTVADPPVVERLTAWSELTYRDKLPRLARGGVAQINAYGCESGMCAWWLIVWSRAVNDASLWGCKRKCLAARH